MTESKEEAKRDKDQAALEKALEKTVLYDSETFSSESDVVASEDQSVDVPELPESVGRYRIHRVMGNGAFGAVYRGYDDQLDRQVAIKVPLLGSGRNSGSDIEKQFLQEARQLAQLSHPNIVTVFDVGVDDGLCYLVADYLEGQNLGDWLKHQTPDWQETVRIVAAIADALAVAHARSIVHRDVKPDNIIITERFGTIVPVLVDFGLALSKSTAGMVGTIRGQIAGTPNYMSPEQARGEGHRIDGRTDIYAVGVLLYRMLCGELPFHSKPLSELLREVIEDEPRPPRQIVHSIPRELEQICLKAMAKQITDRYTTAGDLADELRAVLASKDTVTAAAPTPTSGTGQSRSRETMKILIAEDHELTRFKLQKDLEKWGHQVTIAADGEQAWQLFQSDEFPIVITDWEMPNVDGLELVRRIRGRENADYNYIIMLTAKAEMQDVISGISAGADDFLTKPFQRDELQVRLRAGMRTAKLIRELKETNRRLKRSLGAAAQVQNSSMPTTMPTVPGFVFAWEHRGHDGVGGDMLNVVPLDDNQIALYVLDVSGEGVPAALLATSLSRVMSQGSDADSVLIELPDNASEVRVLEPCEVARALNRRFIESQVTNQFYTLAYGVLNTATREFCFTSAGHTPIVHQRKNTSPTMLDVSGFPIGMAPESEEFEQKSVQLEPGDRLFIYSDGLFEMIG
jgi:serine/threonine protein kinase